MSERTATVAICKCKESRKPFGVRFEKMGTSRWKYTWAFPIKESSAKREGYDATRIVGSIEPDIDYPGCPYCGTRTFVVCDCGKLNCNTASGSYFKCEWCGMSGTLVAYGGGGFGAGGDL